METAAQPHPFTTRIPGVLTIGTDASSPGLFHFGQPGSPDFSGFDVDLCRAVASGLGLVPHFSDCLWSRAIAELNAGTFDAVCTAATITAARRKLVDFSVPYFDVEVAVVVRASTPLKSLAALHGQRIGARIATTAEEALRAFLQSGSVLTYDHNVDAYADLCAGKTDALVDDFPIAAHFVRQQPELKIVATLPGSASQYALMFAKGCSGLRAEVDRVLTQLHKEQFLARLGRKWFGEGR